MGTLFVQLALGLNAFINAQGFARTGMLTVALGAGCNIVLDPIFIFALTWGVQGLPWPRCCPKGPPCLWILCFLRGKQTTLRLQRRTLRLRRKILLPCLALGCPLYHAVHGEHPQRLLQHQPPPVRRGPGGWGL